MQTLTVRLYVDDPDAASYFYLDLFRASIVHRFEYEGRADRIEMEIEGVPFTLIRYPGPKIPANCLDSEWQSKRTGSLPSMRMPWNGTPSP